VSENSVFDTIGRRFNEVMLRRTKRGYAVLYEGSKNTLVTA